jgi:transposase
LARGRLRAKIPQLRVALEGMVRDHHRYLLTVVLDQLDYLSRTIDKISQRIEEISPPSFRDAVRLVSTVDGIQQRTAESILAETGIDMTQFPSATHLSSWAGICPGNNESAGKRKSGKTPKGNRWLRGALGEAACAASRTKATYLAAQFCRIAGRRGKKRALVAVAYTQLIVIYHMLRTNTPYKDLGPDHFERLDPVRLTRHHVQKLQALGYTVTLELTKEAA